MRSLLRSKFFWATATIAAIVIFLLGNTQGQLYSGEVSLLFLPKSDAAVRNLDNILGNAEEIPRSLAFYKKLVQRYPDIEDVGAGLSDYQRRDAWDAKLSASQIGKSSMVKFVVLDKSQFQAEISASAVASDTAAVMSRYYDSKTTLDIRTIDGPIVRPQMQTYSLNWILISLVSGLLLGIIFFLISEFVTESRWEKKLKQSIAPKWNIPAFPRPHVKSQPETRAKPAPQYTRNNLPKGFQDSLGPQTAAGIGVKKAAAPENLPVGSEFVLSSLKRVEEKEKGETAKEQSAQGAKTHEATQEEVRKRLNRLLRGGF